MDELSDYYSEVIGFDSSHENRKNEMQNTSVCVQTNPMQPKLESTTQTSDRVSVNTQTGNDVTATTDDVKLAIWLKKILPQVEEELSKGLTPNVFPDNIAGSSYPEELNVECSQQIAFLEENCSLGHALWLSLYCSDASVLILSCSDFHENWCGHLNQCIKVFVPIREQGKDNVVFTEAKKITLSACAKTISRNPFNKDIFAVATVSGDLHIYKFTNHLRKIDVEEIATECVYENLNYIDWLDETHLIGCMDKGQVFVWNCTKGITKEALFLVQVKEKPKLTVIIALSRTHFIVGTDRGDVIHCIIATSQESIETVTLKKHKFSVTALSKVNVEGNVAVYSCDLSGELFIHDLYKVDSDPDLILHIPLPYKTIFCTSRDGETVFCPAEDGGLDIYNLKNGQQNVKGNLQGKGNCIKMSDNGKWVVTGTYNGHFQIFKIID